MDTNKRSSAKRDNAGKPKISLVLEFGEAIKRLAVALESGAVKYGRGDWENGMPYTVIIDSMLRHTTDFLNGQEYEQESGAAVVDHILSNALMLSEMFWSGDTSAVDDRFTRKNGAS